MSRAYRRLIIPALSLLTLASAPTFAADKFSRIEFLVLRSYNGKPVRNASIVLHPVNKEGKQAKNGVELKTDLDGKTAVDSVPYGKLRIQTIAPGLQTYGDDVEINEPQQQITIKMNRPKEQYSIYK
ncbi:MAG: hypothetical protein ACJ71Q_07520 [Terriglobales bacterium]|jgi:hypothetical protein